MKQIEIKTINSFQFKNWIRTSGSFHFFILQLKSIKWNPIKSIGCIQRILLVCLHFQFNHSNKKKRTEVYLSHSQSIFIWSMSDCRKSIKRSWTNTEKKRFPIKSNHLSHWRIWIGSWCERIYLFICTRTRVNAFYCKINKPIFFSNKLVTWLLLLIQCFLDLVLWLNDDDACEWCFLICFICYIK